MTRRTTAQWRALIESHANIGLTAVAFCRERGLNSKYFRLRRRELSEETNIKLQPGISDEDAEQ